MSEAERIYREAVERARRDHNRMIRRFRRGEIDIATPSGMDRERQYIIAAFEKRLQAEGVR